MEQTSAVAGEPSRNRFTGQVTVILLLVALPLLALLVVQQGRVIDTQRLLIHQLNSDSQQLNAIRAREQNGSSHAQPSATTPQADAPQRPRAGRQSSPAPQRKSPNRNENKQASPPPPLEYPATRPVPVRKSV